MIKGQSVTLLQLDRSGASPAWTQVTVGNVLIAPLSEVDSTVGPLPEGHRALYHLAIPKADENRWEGQLVQFWNQTWAVIGIPTEGIDDLIPGPWNKKVTVELYRTAAPDVDSLWRDKILLKHRIITQDASGYPGTSVTEGREISAIIPFGVIMENKREDGKADLQARMNAEIWENDFAGEDLIGYESLDYQIDKISRTGRGTLLLECTEVRR